MKQNLCVLCLFICITANAAVVWDGTSTPWTKGSGTKADPYLIETPANLKYLANQIDAGNAYADTYFLQTEDFDLNSKSWSMNKTFSGKYDGGNHQILNVGSYLFYIIQSATIQNLTITGNTRYPLVYQVNGSATLTNCHNKSTAEITNGGAGLICQAKSGCVTLTKCSNSATITSCYSNKDSSYGGYTYCSAYTSGLIANADTVVIYNCHNFGNIKLNLHDSRFSYKIKIGGLVAYTNYVDILKSSNTAKLDYQITGYESGAQESVRSGIASASTGQISQCYNMSDNIEYGICNSNKVICTQCYATNSAPSGRYDPHGNFEATFFNLVNIVYYSSSTYYNGEMKVITNTTFNNHSHIDVSGSKTATELKSPSFLSLLNAEGDYFCPDYTNINNGYPILRWQLGDTPFYTIRGICKSEQGTVSGAGEYPQGAQVKLTATPKDNYTFVGWSDGNTNNPRTISVDTLDATYVAQFDRLSYTVYVNQDCSITVE